MAAAAALRIIATARRFRPSVASASRRAASLSCWKIRATPMNVGAVLRNAEAFKIDAVYIVSDDAARFDPEVLHKACASSSASASKWVFTKRFDTTSECFWHLREKRHAKSVVTSPRRHIASCNQTLREVDFTRFTRVAVWFGNEVRGISDEAVAESDICMQIPMYGFIESPNFAVYTGVVLYEVARQRHAFWSASMVPLERRRKRRNTKNSEIQAGSVKLS